MRKIIRFVVSLTLVFAFILGVIAVPSVFGTPFEAEAATANFLPATARTLNTSGRVTTYTSYSTKSVFFREKNTYQQQGYVFSLGYFGQTTCRSTDRVTGYKLLYSDGYIDCGIDTITIISIIDNAIAYVKYPVPNGYKYRYVDLKCILLAGVAPRETHIATCKLTTYKYSTGNATFGSVYKNDKTIYLGTVNERVQFIYPIAGGYKIGFVSKGNWDKYFSRI